MPYFHKDLGMNVYEAAEKRVLHCFSENYLVDIAFSGGKDSIALLLVVVNTMKKYGISFKRLSVTFVDEEAIYPDVPDVVEHYRRMVMSLGGKFYWLCFPWRHYNCTNTLNDEDSWTCWDIRAKDKWVRQPPRYALRWHPDFKYGMSYQEFFKNMAKKHEKFVQMVGLRGAESIQRMQYMQKMAYSKAASRRYQYYIIYDWKDSDVWKIIKDNNAEFPKTYMNLWRIGEKLRMSQIFAADTCKSIPSMLKFYPNFYDALKRRCPNIDIVLLYYDTRMFKRSGQDRAHGKTLTEDEYRVKIRNMLAQAKAEGRTDKGYRNAYKAWTKISRYHGLPKMDTYKFIINMLDGGDAKDRTYRAFFIKMNIAINLMYKNDQENR